jgi:signal transduction histidine kinase
VRARRRGVRVWSKLGTVDELSRSQSRECCSLPASSGCGLLEIEDDGTGFEESSSNETGMGLRIMRHRAKMLGDVLHIQEAQSGGIMLKCQFLLKQNEAWP